MKFVGEVLGNVNGIQYYYIVGLIIFISLMIVILYRTIKMPKKEIIDIKTSIFEKDELVQQDSFNKNNI